MQKMLTKEEIKKILENRIEEIDALNIPHFSILPDIQKAAIRVKEAINNQEKIAIVGDYDVDGVVSSAIMHRFLKFLGANFEVIIPNRFSDGYGLSIDLAKRIKADLIVTVDNGISSFEAAEYLDGKVDLIITDHHSPSQTLPKAYAIVNPKLTNFPVEICGAEVAWYLCAAIKSEMKIEFDLREFLDMLAIAIIADVMPLTHMNRKLTQMGLKRLNRALKPYSRAIKRFFNKELTSEDIAYQIAPRLNAAGRVESADIAYKFLVTEDNEEAYKLWLRLDGLNLTRKEIEREIIESIEVRDDKFLVVSGEFHEGVVGIVASRLVHKYKRPAIVLSKTENGYKGSGRSLGNIDIFELVSECEEFLDKFGGHKLACGLSIKEENVEEFREKLNTLIEKYEDSDFFIDDFVLGEIAFSEIDEELMSIIDSFEPYGEANPRPKFIATAEVRLVQNLKDNHYKLILVQNDVFLPGVIFRYDGEFDSIITFKFSLSRDIYSNIQLMIEEIL